MKIHQRKCRRKQKSLNTFRGLEPTPEITVGGFEMSSDLLTNLQRSTGKNQDEIEMGFANAISEAINENPEKFRRAAKEKGYDV